MLLENKTAVIFGAGAIGGAVARTFAQEGATVFIASRTLASADKVAAEVTAGGGTAEAASVDASDENAVEEYVGDVAARSGQIDILFNAISMLDEVASAAAMMASDRASAMTAAMANVTSGFWVDV